ncbi:zinc finger protein ZAT5-like [Rutidosis leptorrhynchoides]|uniref:zinc finger protein ZAT5-like n=1 Tax=Rutidosis leptorrhynchoides TaxID=125765 RepID=UPI003A9A11A6
MDPSLSPQTAATTINDHHNTPKDPTIIIKGKRTKRPRPPTNIINNLTHSSSSYNTLNSSPTSSSSSTTEDELYTATCLILLSKSSLSHNNNNNNNNDEFFLHNKFTSKKYIHDGSITTGGTYVYECKTCSRTFSSLQALGGHRTSHNKPPKINNFDKRKPAYSDEQEESNLFLSRKNNYSSSSSSISIQINQKKSPSKVHECSICGTEFNSGQALGGHMRRHRVVNGNTTTTSATVTATDTTLSLVPYNVQENNKNQKSINDDMFFDLDLNLPAPQETTVAAADQEEYRETSSKFMAANQNKQQPAVHLSASPTLVDCHY